jgi:hypothetical protein
MSVSPRILRLLQEWAKATDAGDHARALAAAREAIADPESAAIPGLVDVFRHLETDVMATDDPELVRLRAQAAQSLVCCFCGHSRRDVPQLVAGAYGQVCSDCVMECDAVLSGEATLSASIAVARVGDPGHCSFCGAADVARAVGLDTASICATCVRRIQAMFGEMVIKPRS